MENQVRKKRINKEAIFIVDSLPQCLSPPIATPLLGERKIGFEGEELIMRYFLSLIFLVH